MKKITVLFCLMFFVLTTYSQDRNPVSGLIHKSNATTRSKTSTNAEKSILSGKYLKMKDKDNFEIISNLTNTGDLNTHDSTYYFYWDATSEEWDNEDRIYPDEMDDDGNWLEATWYYLSLGTWYKYAHYNYTYDDNGNNTEYKIQVWMSSYWYDYYSTYSEYDDNDNLTEYTDSLYVDGGDSASYYNEVYTYNSSDLQTEYLLKYWNYTNAEWVNSEYTTYSYLDGYDYEDEIITQEWNATSESWVNSEAEYYDYTGSEYWQIAMKTWNTDSSAWQKDMLIQITWYDQSTGIITEIDKEWNEDSAKYINSEKYVYTYNSNQKISQIQYLAWNADDAEWIEVEEVEYSYTDDNITEYIYFEYSTEGKAISGEKYDQEFDSDGNATCIIISEWNKDDQEWVYDEKYEYYYANNVAISDVEQTNIECLYSNPYQTGNPITVDLNTEPENCVVNLFDYTGKKVYTQTLQTSGTFEIQETFQTGMYIMTITNNNQILLKDKIIITD